VVRSANLVEHRRLQKALRLTALRALSTLIVNFCQKFCDRRAIGVLEYLLHLTSDTSNQAGLFSLPLSWIGA